MTSLIYDDGEKLNLPLVENPSVLHQLPGDPYGIGDKVNWIFVVVEIHTISPKTRSASFALCSVARCE